MRLAAHRVSRYNLRPFRETRVTVDLITLGFASFVLALSGALVPGPMFSAVVAGSHRRGFWFGPRVILGHALAEIVALALLLVGLMAFLDNPWVLITIAGVGAIMLVWMGVGLVRQSRRPPEVAADAGVLRWGATATGVLTSVLNPYWYVWWVTQPAVLLTAAAGCGWPGVVVFFIGHISADFAWYSATSFGISRGRNILRGWRYKALMIGCAAILFVMAAVFVRLAVGRLAE
jgi:threonine/homoserine/homoserine lactone efflux protein